MFKELLRYVLPKELVDFFDLVNLQEQEGSLHMYILGQTHEIFS